MIATGSTAERVAVPPDPAADLAAERIALRRRVLDWRDHWGMEAELRLRSRGMAVTQDLSETIASLRTHQLIAARAGATDPPALPAIVEELTAEANRVTAEALEKLRTIVAHHLAIEAKAGKAGESKGAWAGQALAIGQGLAPIAAAAGLLAALPALATTTTTAMLGLVAVSTISAPTLVVGAGGAAALGALGVINLKGLRSAEERKLRVAIETEMERRLFAATGDNAEPSLLARLRREFANVAQQLMDAR